MPQLTELDKPMARCALAANTAATPRASMRKRGARRGSTTMILAGANRAARVTVLRNKLTPRTWARAFGRPNREENPAASITNCSLRLLRQAPRQGIGIHWYHAA